MGGDYEKRLWGRLWEETMRGDYERRLWEETMRGDYERRL